MWHRSTYNIPISDGPVINHSMRSADGRFH